MSQSTFIKVPTTLHAQLKAVAAARGTTMTAVIHRAVQEAIANGEIPDELPGYQLKVELDLDAKPGEIGSAFTVATKAGEWPVMDEDDLVRFAETLATMQPNASPRGEAIDCTLVKGGRIEAGFIGNAIKIEAHHRGSDVSVTNVLTVAGARDLARQLAKSAKPLTA